MIKKGQLFGMLSKRQFLTVAVLIVAVAGVLFASYRSYAKVAVFPATLVAECTAGEEQIVEFIIRNRTVREVAVLGVSSDCGCFHTKTDLPLKIKSSSAIPLKIGYRCPAKARTNTISIMLEEKGTLKVLKVFVQHK